MSNLELKEIVIKRDKNSGWIVTRQREESGERIQVDNLQEAFDAIAVLYDRDGNYRYDSERWPKLEKIDVTAHNEISKTIFCVENE